jgi:clan AA aspartic protease (TIGR02281 family)
MTAPRLVVIGWLIGLALLVPLQAALAEAIQLRKQGGGYLVRGQVNGAVEVDFVLDTGASDVLIPDAVARALNRAGKLSRQDYLGRKTYVLADGSRVSSQRIMLRELTVGGHTVNNVTASIGRARSPALLGQSFLSKFPSWTLDNERHVLVLSTKAATDSRSASADRAQASAGAKYGAFAHDGTSGRYGLSWNHDMPSLADEAALKGCASDTCKIVFRTGARECGAIATTNNGKIWGGATRPTRAAAEVAAIENCRKRSTSPCQLRGAHCNR